MVSPLNALATQFCHPWGGGGNGVADPVFCETYVDDTIQVEAAINDNALRLSLAFQ